MPSFLLLRIVDESAFCSLIQESGPLSKCNIHEKDQPYTISGNMSAVYCPPAGDPLPGKILAAAFGCNLLQASILLFFCFHCFE